MRVVHLFLEYPHPYQPYNVRLIERQNKYGIEAIPVSIRGKRKLHYRCSILFHFWLKLKIVVYFTFIFVFHPKIILQYCNRVGLRDTVIAHWNFWKFLKLKPNIIHVHHYMIATKEFVDFFEFYKIPWCYSIRGRDVCVVPLIDKTNFKRIKFVLESAKGLHAVANSLKHEAVKLGISPKKICVIYRAVENKLSYKKEEYAIHNPCSLLFLGRFSWEKGLIYLVHATKLLISNGKEVKLHICGSGNSAEIEELKFLVNRHGIGGYVVFHGYVDDNNLDSLLPEIDMVVQPSVYEGIPNGLIKVFQTGIPVIASRVGGITEIIKDGYNGVLVNSCSPFDIARAISKLISDENQRRFLGENAKRTELQNAEREAYEYKVFYSDMIANGF